MKLLFPLILLLITGSFATKQAPITVLSVQNPPTPIEGIGSFLFDNTQVPTAANPVFCDAGAGISGATGFFYHEVWYEWTPTEDGQYKAWIDAVIDGVIGIWDSNGVAIDCDDCVGTCPDTIEFEAQESNTYLIALGGWTQGSQAVGTLEIHEQPQGITYCTAAPNSTGAGAYISYWDTALHVTGAVPNEPGIFFFGPSQINLPFGNGVRCVGGAVTRIYPPVFSNSSGNVIRPLIPIPGMYYQYWYRDPIGAGFNLSDAISL